LAPFFTLAPTQTVVIRPGSGFKIEWVNLPACGSDLSAVFRVTNTDDNPFESALLEIVDLGSGQVLFGPNANDSPFTNTDRSCYSWGIDSLQPGQSLFLGVPLGGTGLKGHSIQASLTLCSDEGVSGACYQQIAEFVIP
jgi:hypothetical protein